jgi:hypothetical protein
MGNFSSVVVSWGKFKLQGTTHYLGVEIVELTELSAILGFFLLFGFLYYLNHKERLLRGGVTLNKEVEKVEEIEEKLDLETYNRLPIFNYFREFLKSRPGAWEVWKKAAPSSSVGYFLLLDPKNYLKSGVFFNEWQVNRSLWYSLATAWDYELNRPHIQGLIVKGLSPQNAYWGLLLEFLAKEGAYLEFVKELSKAQVDVSWVASLDPKNFIGHALKWDKTSLGSIYWQKIDSLWKTYLSRNKKTR